MHLEIELSPLEVAVITSDIVKCSHEGCNEYEYLLNMAQCGACGMRFCGEHLVAKEGGKWCLEHRGECKEVFMFPGFKHGMALMRADISKAADDFGLVELCPTCGGANATDNRAPCTGCGSRYTEREIVPQIEWARRVGERLVADKYASVEFTSLMQRDALIAMTEHAALLHLRLQEAEDLVTEQRRELQQWHDSEALLVDAQGTPFERVGQHG